MRADLIDHLRDVVGVAIGHAPPRRALVLYDERSPLARRLVEGYRAAVPHATFLDFDGASHDDVFEHVGRLTRGDLVVLVQSTRFDVRAFRFRLELFQRGLAVIEHPHLGRMEGEEIDRYVDALAYDPAYYRGVGRALKHRIDRGRTIDVRSGDARLHYDGPFEDAKLNVGDYTALANVGGQFPIGEVFTEPVDLRACNGEVDLFAYGRADFSVAFLEEPCRMSIRDGRVGGMKDAPAELLAILDSIRVREGDVWLRELGFGLNRAFTKARRVTDVGTYERMCGVHFSLGAKHAVYPKAGFHKRDVHFHVDVFADVSRVEIDGTRVFDGESYVLPEANS